MEKHPGIASKVSNELGSLWGHYMNVAKSIRNTIPVGKEQTQMLENAKVAFAEQRLSLMKQHKQYQMFNRAVDLTNKQQIESRKRFNNVRKTIGKVGYRLGWLSFRLIIVGRLLMRYMMQPIQKMVQTLTNWEQSVQSGAESLAYLAYTGHDVSDIFGDNMPDAMKDTILAGLELKGALGAIQWIITQIATDLGPILVPMLLDIARAMKNIWDEVSPTLIPALQRLTNEVLPPLIDLFERIGPALITGLVSGITQAIPTITWLIGAFGWLAEPLARVIGFLLPFAPIMVAIGTALYFVSPILTIISAVMGALSVALPAISGGMVAVAGGIKAIGTSAMVTAPGLLTIALVAGAIAVAIFTVAAAIALLTGKWKEFTGGIANVIDSIRGVKRETNSYREANQQLSDDLKEDWEKSIGDDIASQLDIAKRALTDTQRAFNGANLAVGEYGVRGIDRGGFDANLSGEGTQHITIEEVNLYIDNIESVEELEGITESAVTGIAEGVRSRFR